MERFREDNGTENAGHGCVRTRTGRFWDSTSDAVVAVIQVLVESSGRMPSFAIEELLTGRLCR